MAWRCLFDLVRPVKTTAMKDDLVSALNLAEDCTPPGSRWSASSHREQGVLTNTAALGLPCRQ